jgi:hypothetical protein
LNCSTSSNSSSRSRWMSGDQMPIEQGTVETQHII